MTAREFVNKWGWRVHKEYDELEECHADLISVIEGMMPSEEEMDIMYPQWTTHDTEIYNVEARAGMRTLRSRIHEQLKGK